MFFNYLRNDVFSFCIKFWNQNVRRIKYLRSTYKEETYLNYIFLPVLFLSLLLECPACGLNSNLLATNRQLISHIP